MYGFTGGGLPSHVRTVFIEYFQNGTPYEFLRSDVQRELQQDLPRNLGVRLAPQTSAHAIIRGELRSYSELTVNIDPNTTPGGRITANQRRVEITFDAEIYDVREDKLLWQGNGISAIGNYDPEREGVDLGRQRAIDELVRKLIEGAQSQW